MSKDLSDRDERPYCYIDHANKQMEIYAANPYLSWLNESRKERAKASVGDGAMDADDQSEATPAER